jgi:L-ascorbate metabolism protein UlaG (beta-lactamase superfamily)
MSRKYRLIFIPVFVLLIVFSGCNLFYVAVRNVPVFFSSPEKVANKIKNPVKDNVRLSALWIGHSTVLLQMDDKVIITDPILTETVGELGRRLVEPGIDVENIPRCDLILISHSHFDHLSYGSLGYLEEKSSGAPLVFPTGLEYYLPQMDFKFIRMDNDNGYEKNIIGEEKLIGGIKVTSVYAQHWGGRYGLDGYVWGEKDYTGYVIQYHGLTVYFAGDTGYDSTKFKQLGEMFKIDLAFIPIGPCADCEQCGTPNHIFPPEAVWIFKDVKARWLVPIHYGTLYFAQADAMKPLETLNKIIKEENLGDKISVLKIGEQKVFIQK